MWIEDQPNVKEGSAPVSKSNPDCVELYRLCREGRLFEVEEYCRAGKTVNFTHDNAAYEPLGVAIEKGFRSLAEVLLRNGARPDGRLLYFVFRRRKLEYLNLLFEHGADLRSLKSWYPHCHAGVKTVRLFVERGDITTGNPIAKGLVDHPKEFLQAIAPYRGTRSDLQLQLDMALRCQIENWDSHQSMLVKRLVEGGANPRSAVPLITKWSRARLITPMQAAASCCRADLVRVMGIDPAADDLNDLLVRSSGSDELSSLLLGMGANANVAARGLRPEDRIRFRRELRENVRRHEKKDRQRATSEAEGSGL